MNKNDSDQEKPRLGCLARMAILTVLVIGFIAIQYTVDRGNLNKGRQALSQADCKEAIGYFDRIINKWRLTDIGNFASIAESNREVCLFFSEAVEHQEANAFNLAVGAYSGFLLRHGNSYDELAVAARQKNAEIFDQDSLSSVADNWTCQMIDLLLTQSLIPEHEQNLPRFYHACGEFYYSVNEKRLALEMYDSLFSEYPDHPLATELESQLLKDPSTCDEALTIRRVFTEIASREGFMSSLLYDCGLAYAAAENYDESFELLNAFLSDYPQHKLIEEVEAALFANPRACRRVVTLQSSVSSDSSEFMPLLYYDCGQVYDVEENYAKSFEMYMGILVNYPEHMLAEGLEIALSNNPVACQMHKAVSNAIRSERSDFLPTFYHNCGHLLEDASDWQNAIDVYEVFLAEFPQHSLVSSVESGLARAIVGNARAVGAGTIPTPERVGSTDSNIVELVIQNDSPERLRIVFSGPEPRFEEISACTSCRVYFASPQQCPELGPVSRFSIDAGDAGLYDVVVESISDSGVTPWRGLWNLQAGGEYHHCFVIVRSLR
ncbi:tetratricopeptide repeat protein [Candidatus Leptofilum sp.]|uniref:tetratricopeptide repeat protein n=1 Tax=Candidatus Leptofilum sp. TaxID=3241576 RepID=UPI003B5CD621